MALTSLMAWRYMSWGLCKANLCKVDLYKGNTVFWYAKGYFWVRYQNCGQPPSVKAVIFLWPENGVHRGAESAEKNRFNGKRWVSSRMHYPLCDCAWLWSVPVIVGRE